MLLLKPRRLLRAVLVAGAVVLPIVVAFDAGSVAVMRIAAKDNADEAGRAGVASIALINEATPAAAQTAFDDAKQVADGYGETIDPNSFRVHSDGSVTLTVKKSTDTVLFDHVPGLGGLTRTQTTLTVDRSAW